MKYQICTINLSSDAGRQTIYWDTEDRMLHSTADEGVIDICCASVMDAQDAAWQLWGRVPGWDLEWNESEDNSNDQ